MRHNNYARTHIAWLVFLASVAMLAILAGLLAWNSKHPSEAKGQALAPAKPPLLVYCAAGVRSPVEAAARDYEQFCGVPVQLQYGGSQTLLASLEVSKRGDLYLPADDSYLALAQQKNLVLETVPLARMQARLAVRKGNPKQIHSFSDLLRPDVKVALANPDAAAIGKLTREVLQKTGQWDPLKARTIVFKPTVNDVGNDIKLGTVDAGLLWNALDRQYPDLDFLALPIFTNIEGRIAVAVVRTSAHPDEASAFARYLGARDQGLRRFQEYGYETVEGDVRAASAALSW